MSSTELPLFMSAAELAEAADCSEERVEELARAGIIPGLKWGRSWRFPREGTLVALADLGRQGARERAAQFHAARLHFQVRRAAKDARRRAAKLQRTPSWADYDAIAAVYAEAQRLTRATGVPHHVDHAIPLQGKLVSGLHVHQNLQILTGLENIRKCNRFEVEP
jgi:hypothetical protein